MEIRVIDCYESKISDEIKELIDDICYTSWAIGAYGDTLLGYDEGAERIERDIMVKRLVDYISCLEKLDKKRNMCYIHVDRPKGAERMRLVEKKEYLVPNEKGDIVGVFQLSKGEWMFRTYKGNVVSSDFLLNAIGHMNRLNNEVEDDNELEQY